VLYREGILSDPIKGKGFRYAFLIFVRKNARMTTGILKEGDIQDRKSAGVNQINSYGSS
jgi:hypothetical protein